MVYIVERKTAMSVRRKFLQGGKKCIQKLLRNHLWFIVPSDRTAVNGMVLVWWIKAARPAITAIILIVRIQPQSFIPVSQLFT